MASADRNIQPVMEYFPTPEQYSNPAQYIQEIYEEASLYGVAVINPPAGADFHKSSGPAEFETKLLRVAPLQRSDGDPGFEVSTGA